MERREHGHLVSEHVAAITRWVGNLRIVDRRITRNDQSRINQRPSSRQVRESGFERHLASPQDGDRVQRTMATSGWRRNGEEQRGRGENKIKRERRREGELSRSSPSSNDFTLSKPQAYFVTKYRSYSQLWPSQWRKSVSFATRYIFRAHLLLDSNLKPY